MSAPIRVSAEELKRHWFGPAAVGMVEDHQRQVRIIRMDDGTEFECPFVEIIALQKSEALR